MKTFSDDSIRRIVRSVLWTERRSLTVPQPQSRRNTSLPLPRAVIASEDIEHNNLGEVAIASASSWETPTWVDGTATLEVYNPGQKIWEGSHCIVDSCGLQSGRVRWVIRNAFSATKIQGVASTDVEPGGSTTITSVTPIDGHFEPTTAVVELPTGVDGSVESGKVVRAELVAPLNPGESSRWEIYSGVCCSGGGGVPIQTYPVVNGWWTDVDGAAGLFRDNELVFVGPQTLFNYQTSIIAPFVVRKMTWFWAPIVDVPQGAVVVSAQLSWQSIGTIGTPRTVDIRAAAQDDAPRPTSAADIMARPKTVNWAQWSIANITAGTPDIKSVVQEVVSRAGWVSGNSMLFLMENPDQPNFPETLIEGLTPLLEVSFST